MDNSMQHTEITDPSTDAQVDEQPSRMMAAWKAGFYDGLSRILGVLEDCPPWCNDHWFPTDCGIDDFEEEHFHRHTAPTGLGDIDIVTNDEDGGRPMLALPQVEDATIEQARTFAADLVRVCDAFEAAQRHGS